MRMKAGVVATILGVVVGLVPTLTAEAASIAVTPTSVPVGGTVTLTGDVLGPNGQPGCQVPGTVTLISGAFAGQGSFQNQDVETTAGADGKYRVQAKILSGVAPGTYTITARCGGANLGVQATLTVTPAPPVTGSGPESRSEAPGGPGTAPFLAAALLALALLAAGWLLRRRFLSTPRR